MSRVSLLLLFALLASAAGVPDVSIPAIVVGGDDAAPVGVHVEGPHYESPPCGADEKAVRVMGIDGVFCSPTCDPNGECPPDVPAGVTAHPTCALQSPTGDKFCAILCTPSSSSQQSLRGGDCGPMNCAAVPNAGGIGLCVYAEEDPIKEVVTEE